MKRNILLFLFIYFSCFDVRSQNLISSEYFFDTDPGVGYGNPFSFSADTTLDIIFSASVSSLTAGHHIIYFRAKDQNGNWSCTKSDQFYLYSTSSPMLPASSQLSIGEYYFDVDPGVGNGNSFTFTADTAIDLNISISTNSLVSGHHILFLRVKDATGNWSISKSTHIYIFQVLSQTFLSSPIIAAEYYFDTDPGVGHGIFVQGINAGDSIEKYFVANTTGLDSGNHILYLRTKDISGNWSLVKSEVFNLYNSNCTLPIADFSFLTGNAGSPVSFNNLSTQTILGTTYSWDINSDSTIEYTTPGISHTFISPGIYPVKLTVLNSDSCFSIIVKNVIVGPTPDTSIQVSGSTTFCEGDSIILTAASGYQYLWSTGATTVSIVVKTAGSYFVQVTDNNFTLSSAIVSISVNPLPEFTLQINNSNGGNSNGGISVVLNGYSTLHYLWSNGNTTSIVSNISAGTYYVSVSNGYCLLIDTAIVSNSPVPALGLLSAEYFFDSDPGPGSGIPFLISQGDSVEQYNQFNIGNLVSGNHYIYLRVKNEAGFWSIAKPRRILVHNALPPVVFQSPTLIQAEYFFDSDPGVGLGSQINFSSSDSVDLNINIPVSALSKGHHNLFIRVKDQDAKWGITRLQKIYIYDTTAVHSQQASTLILSAEYFVDNDPGVGQGKISNGINPGDSINEYASLTLDSLIPGTHFLYVRAKDFTNHWGITKVIPFSVLGHQCIMPVPDFTADTVNPGTPTTLINTSTALQPGVNFKWDILNDGSIDYTAPNILHTFNSPGIYYVKLIVENSDTCTAFRLKKVVVGNLPMASINPSGIVNLCQGDSVILSSTSSTGNSWSNGDTTQSIIVKSSGIFIVQVTNSQGLTAVSNPVEVVLRSAPQVSITSFQSYNNQPSGGATAVVTGGTGNYSYNWSNGQTTPIAIHLLPGNYQLTVNDGYCFAGAYTNIVDSSSSNSIIVAAEYFFDTDPGTGNANSLPAYGDNVIELDSITIGNMPIGYHNLYVRVRDTLQRWSIAKKKTVYIYDPLQPPQITSSSIVRSEYFYDSDPGTGNGNNVFIAVGDSVDATFQVSSTGLSIGQHFLCLRSQDMLGNWSILKKQKIYVYDSSPSLISHSSPLISAEYFYDTDPGVGNGQLINFSLNDSTDITKYITVNNLDTGSHNLYLRAKDLLGNWSIPKVVHFHLHPSICTMPVVNFESDTVNFNTLTTFSNLTDSVNGNTSYLWDVDNDGTDDYATRDITHIYSYPGIYQAKLKVENDTGCIVTLLKDVLVGPLPNKDVQVNGSLIICSGDSTILSASSGFTYQWSTGSTLQSITVKNAGNYWVTVSNSYGISLTSDVVAISVAPALLVNLQVANSTNGSNGSIYALVSGGNGNYQYTWSDGQTTQLVTNLASGNYVLTVTDGNCIKTISGTVGAGPVTGIIYAEFFVDIDPGVGNGIALNISAGDSIDQYANIPLNQFAPGRHRIYLRVKDLNNSWSIAKSTLIYIYNNAVTYIPQSPQLIAAEYFIQTDSGVTHGTSVPIVSGDSIDGNFSINVTGIPNGNYNLYFRSMDADSSWSIAKREPFSIVNCHSTSIAVVDATCHGVLNGSADLTLSGTSGPYIYLWSNGNTTEDLSSVTDGTYIVHVTDVDGCQTIDTAVVNAPSFISLNIQTTQSACTTSNGSATLQIIGGTSPFTYHWSNGQVTSVANNLAAGVYSVTVTDSIGCVINDTFSIQNSNVPVITISSITNNICFGETNGTININVTGGTSPYAYLWSNGATNEDVASLSAGQYAVLINDNGGCAKSASAVVTQPSKIVTNIIPTPVTTLNGTNGFANLSLSGGVPPYNYIWSNGATIQDLSGISAGHYTVTITDFKNCSVVDSVNVITDVGPPFCSNALFPANGSITAPVVSNLSWSPAAHNPTGYKLYIGFDSLNLQLVSSSNTTLYPFSLLPYATLFWKVVPYNSFGDATGCQINRFTTAGIPPACAVNVSPNDHAVNVLPNSSLNWIDGGGSPYGYNLYFGTNPNNLSQYFTTLTTFPITTVPNTTYYWKVIPINSIGSASSCPLWTFSTIYCPSSTISLAGSALLCPGQTKTLTASSGISYIWNTGATTNSIVVTIAGNYSVTINTGIGCSIASNPIAITNAPAPQVNSNAGNTICQGDTILLNYSPVTSVLWSTGSTSSIISVSPTTSTTYYVQGTTSPGCNFSDSIHINVNPFVAPGVVSNMFPSSGTQNLSNPVNLSWLPGSNNSQFDLFLWDTLLSQPSVPLYSNISSINLSIGNLIYDRTYRWFIISKNGNCYSSIGPVQTFTMRKLPDLSVQNITVPSTAFSGQPSSITWTITNNSTGITGYQFWSDAVYLSADPFFQPAFDFYLGAIGNTTSLLSYQSYNSTFTTNIPNGYVGNYYIIILTDGFNQLLEENENNNTTVSALPINIMLTPPPDLIVLPIVNQANVYSSTNTNPNFINITYTVKNNGSGSTGNSAWTDRVRFNSQPFFDPSSPIAASYNFSGILLPDSTYTITLPVLIPSHVTGPFFIYVETDVTNNVFELPFEGNNINSSNIQIFLTPPPDLVVTSINTPTSVSAGQPVNINWNVENAGVNQTDNDWSDRIYMSPISNLTSFANAIVLGDYYHSGVLNPGDIYSGQTTVTIPDAATGINYFYVVTDVNNQLFESLNENNNSRRSDSSVLILNPDLLVTTVSTPSFGNSGQTFSINWNILNSGTGGIYNRTRRDLIYLSSNSVFNVNNSVLIDSLTSTETILSNAGINKQKTIILPNGISGTYYIFIHTDGRNMINESNDNNNINTLVGSFTINLSPWPDLFVNTLQSNDTVISMYPASVSGRVTNVGAGTINSQWSDKIYISTDSVWNISHAYQIGTLQHNQYLGSYDLYTNTLNFSLPYSGNISGFHDSCAFYFYEVVDNDNQLFEHSGESNNVFRSTRKILLDPHVDLQMTNVTCSDSLYGGHPANITWSVKNLGGRTTGHTYYDAIVFSTDTVYDASDLVAGFWYMGIAPDSNQMYQESRSFTVPSNLNGNYYIFMVTNSARSLPTEYNFSNNQLYVQGVNGGPVSTTVIYTQPPDLIITNFQAPNIVQAGQPITLHFTVKNNGVGDTYPGAWYEGFLLSNDNIYGSDIGLGSTYRNTLLHPGESYSDSLQITIPINYSGNYFLLGHTDIYNQIFESVNESNNVIYSLITIFQPLPSDLVVNSIIIPDSANAGLPVTVNWDVNNFGNNPATGYMSEGIYFSKDSLWDINDPLIGTSPSFINLPPGAHSSHSFTTDLNYVTLGYHHVIVRTDLLDNILESNENNNSTVSTDSVFVTVKELPLNTLVPDQLINNDFMYYRVEVDDSLVGETMSIRLTGDSLFAANELYVRFNDIPTRSTFDFGYGNPNYGNQEILIPSLVKGTYYITIYGIHATNNHQNITLYAEILPFAIRNVNANSGGNTGTVTVQMRGSKFENGMTAILHPVNGGNDIITTQISYINTTKLFTTFNLLHKDTGLYDVLLKKADNSIAYLYSGFTIEQGNTGGFYIGGVSNGGQTGSPLQSGCDPGADAGINQLLQLGINAPASVRRGTSFTMTVIFGNSGNVDIPIPTRFFVSADSVPVSLTVADLANNKYEIYLEFRELNGPTDVLRPGATGGITIYSLFKPAGVLPGSKRFILN